MYADGCCSQQYAKCQHLGLSKGNGAGALNHWKVIIQTSFAFIYLFFLCVRVCVCFVFPHGAPERLIYLRLTRRRISQPRSSSGFGIDLQLGGLHRVTALSSEGAFYEQSWGNILLVALQKKGRVGHRRGRRAGEVSFVECVATGKL